MLWPYLKYGPLNSPTSHKTQPPGSKKEAGVLGIMLRAAILGFVSGVGTFSTPPLHGSAGDVPGSQRECEPWRQMCLKRWSLVLQSVVHRHGLEALVCQGC